MDEDRSKGTFDKLKGKVKEATGKATGNERLEGEGKADQVGGQAKKTVGEVKDTARDVTGKR